MEGETVERGVWGGRRVYRLGPPREKDERIRTRITIEMHE